MNDPKLLTTQDVTALLGVTRTTLIRWVSIGKFPAPRKVAHISVWPEDQVLAKIKTMKTRVA